MLISGGSYVVSNTSKDNKCWHSWCFVCSRCGVNLTHNQHYLIDGELLCDQHVTDHLGLHQCAACHKIILDTTYVRAEKKYWHSDHFSCWYCCKRLGSEAGDREKYIMLDNGHPSCVQCWSRNNSRKCAACGSVIRFILKT